MTDQNNATQAAEQEIDAIMEQAQVFASAWSFLGGPFDNGSGLETAERERAALRMMISKLCEISAPAAGDAPALLDALQTLRRAFVIAVGDRSPFAKQALAKADAAIAQQKGEA